MKHANSIKLELVCKKISWRILPLIVLMFCLSMLDRTNISFVKSHIEIDAGIGEAAY
ncbi:TPA: MFS transporter, partial [Campylobacter jejuni]|nr:MFS transporter [Campylobacter jejuni]